jgi:Sel1 repeat
MNGFNIFISDVQAIFMKRAFSAIFCCAMLLALSGAANADPASDRDMANRYLQAARSGDDDAQFYVAALYSAGVGVPRSDEEAFRWFARAADQGHSHAMLIVGGLYAIGRGVEKDNVKAYQYAYIVNSATKVEEFRNGSRQLLGVLESKMTPDEVSRARAEAGRWRPVSNAPPQQPPPPADTSRVYQAQPAPTAAAAPPPPPAVSNAQPPAKTNATSSASSNTASSANSDDLAAASDSPGKTTKKNDIDSLLDQVPQGIRKRFGF